MKCRTLIGMCALSRLGNRQLIATGQTRAETLAVTCEDGVRLSLGQTAEFDTAVGSHS